MLRRISTSMVALCMAAGISMVGCSDDDGAVECGDGLIEDTEVCDDTNLDGRTCADEGFDGGDLACNDTCTDYDTSACTNTADVCGDDVIGDTEDCEGTDLDNTTCADLNFDGGTLACNDTTCAFDDSGCTTACTDNCTAEDDTQCTGDILGTCTLGADDCLDWVDTDCTDDGQICDSGGATAVCADDCTSDCTTIGDTECVDATNLNTCADSGNGCMNWTASVCAGGYCGGDPADCETSGAGDACDDVYNLNGRTYPHTMTGMWDTGAYTFQGTCQDGAHPIYLSYTVQGTSVDSLVFEATETTSSAWPQVSAWTTTEATGFCIGAQMTEIGCMDDSGWSTATLILDGSGLAQGDVIYFLLSGDGASWELNDPEITVLETVCGDGDLVLGESCDDGNTTSGDGCDASCIVEPGYDCIGTTPSVCTFLCGDSTIDATTNEECDDGNATAGDGCDALCQVEATYWCTGEPSNCMIPACGDGYLNDAAEECDDTNTTVGDGCSDTCLVETGYVCTGEPSTCAIACGNGTLDPNEECDDGNTTAGDGCDASCAVELFACGTGETLVTIVSTDVPVTTISSNVVTSTVTVPNTGTVTRVKLTLVDLTHTYDSDLSISLISPTSTAVGLSAYNGSWDENYTGTIFDDGCAGALGLGPITGGSAPFTGCYSPEEPLSTFAGEAANGVWTLEVDDCCSGDDGSINAWTLDLCIQ